MPGATAAVKCSEACGMVKGEICALPPHKLPLFSRTLFHNYLKFTSVMLRPFTTVFVDRFKAKRGKEYEKKDKCLGLSVGVNGPLFLLSLIYIFSFLVA